MGESIKGSIFLTNYWCYQFPICENDLWGVVKIDGTSLVDCNYKQIWYYTLSNDKNIRYFACEMQDGTYGIIDWNGKVVVPFKYLGLNEEKEMIVLGHWVNDVKYFATYNPKTWTLISDEVAE